MCLETGTKDVLFIFNLVFLVIGLSTAAIGARVLCVREDYDELIGSSLIGMGAYFAIVGGGIVAFIALAGCAGALTKSTKLLKLYIILLLLVFLIQAIAGVIGFVYYGKVRSILDDNVKNSIFDTYGYEEYNAVTLGINTLQQKLECCGYTKPADWSASTYFNDPDTAGDRGINKVPVSCCKDMLESGCNDNFDDKIHSEGCVPQMESILKKHLLIVAALSLSVALFQLLGIVLAVVIRKKTKEQKNQRRT